MWNKYWSVLGIMTWSLLGSGEETGKWINNYNISRKKNFITSCLLDFLPNSVFANQNMFFLLN